MGCRPGAKGCRIARAPSSSSRRRALRDDSGAQLEGFGVYVHWPFCLSKCPYCDFNSHVRHGGIDEARYTQAFLREMASAAKRTPGREVTTVFFGGGTPSLMKPQTVAAILDGIAKNWTVARDVEVTLEA